MCIHINECVLIGKFSLSEHLCNLSPTPQAEREKILDNVNSAAMIIGMYVSFFFFFGCPVWHVGSYFPVQWLNPCPLHWKHRILTPGSPGKSHMYLFELEFLSFLEWDCLIIY